MNLNTNSTKAAEDWCVDYCDGRKASEFTANLTLVEKYKAVENAKWMESSRCVRPKKLGLIARVLRFLGV